jgi:hypothetical protein
MKTQQEYLRSAGAKKKTGTKTTAKTAPAKTTTVKPSSAAPNYAATATRPANISGKG